MAIVVEIMREREICIIIILMEYCKTFLCKLAYLIYIFERNTIAPLAGQHKSACR